MNPIAKCLDYQIPVTRQKGPNGDGDIQAVRRDLMRHLPVISIYGYMGGRQT